MKITFVVARANLSGGARVVATYAERLRRRGHEVLVVSTPKPDPTLKQQVKSLVKGKGLINKPKKEPSHLELVDVPHKVINHTPPIVDRDLPDADVVIANWWETAEWVANLSQTKGAKAYFMQDYGFPPGIPGQKLENIIPTWRLPLHIITISEWLVDLIHDYAYVPVSLVPNSVDLELFSALPRTKQPNPTFGTNYRTSLIKGGDIILEAFQIAQKRIPQIRLLMFGSQKPSFSALPDNVFFDLLPSNQKIVEIYSNCDGWLFGSRREGFGLPILEAMACRTPVIGTPAGAAPELLSQDGGILVKQEDPEDMARAIEKICQLPAAEWQAMSNAAYQTATSYTWEDATDLFEEALYTAIKRSSR